MRLMEVGRLKAIQDPQEFTSDLRPKDYETCDWRWNCGRRGRHPAFWDFVCHSACHWVNVVAFLVAQKALPQYDWQLASSDLHTTVIDLKSMMLFDPNFLAIGVSADEAVAMALHQPSSEITTPPWTV
jgi:hypothetical protein